MNLIDAIKNAKKQSTVFVDNKGREHSVEVAAKKGIEGKIVTRDGSRDLKEFVFGKSRVGKKDMEELAEIIGRDNVLYQTIYEGLSYATKKKVKK